MKVAFYAPMKAPDSPTPSGDRTLARLFLTALRRGGFEPVVAARLRTWTSDGDTQALHRIWDESEAIGRELVDRWASAPASERPSLWFTYHCYWKAPDLIGPRVSQALGIPYVIAEPIHAPTRASGTWAQGFRAAEAALDAAQLLLPLTRRDLPALEARRARGQAIVPFPPFTDLAASKPAAFVGSGPVRLATVAMMRNDAKLAGFHALAEALRHIGDRDWTLDVMGGGPARAEVEAWFAPLALRVRFAGVIEDRPALAERLASAHVFVWPAEREAFGMAYLEAQACGCAVVGTAVGGVPEAVVDGRTGLLVPPRDPRRFADAILRFLDEPGLLAAFRLEAARWVASTRSLEAAAQRLRALLLGLCAQRAA